MKQETYKCTYKTNGNACGGDHHRMLHGCGDARINAVAFTDHSGPHPDVLMALVPHDIDYANKMTPTVLFMDHGSNCSIITHSLARQLGLRGQFSMEMIELAGRAPELLETKYYTWNWKLPNGTIRRCKMLGLEKITSNPGPADVSPAYSLFPQIPEGALERPTGDVGILIGMDQPDLLPAGGTGRYQAGSLRVLSTMFGSGHVLVGHHPDIQLAQPQLSSAALQWKSAKFLDHKNFQFNAFSRVNLCICCTLQAHELPEMNILQPDTPRKCKRCLSCPTCQISETGRTIREQFELDQMREGLKYNREEKFVTVKYPVIGDPTLFRDNYNQVTATAASLWKRLEKLDQLQIYNQQIQDYILRGVIRETSIEDVEAWKAQGKPVHYVSHHGVQNSHSKSTPLRVVVNSATKNCNSGPSLNQYYGKGPNSINSLYSVLMRWREFDHALVYDVSKAYHQMRTGDDEFYMRLMVWKFEKGEKWRIFGHDRSGMGDPPASTNLELTKEVASDEGKHIDEKAAEQLKKNGYVDDGLGGGKKHEVMRMRGNCVKTEEGLVFDGTVSQILATVGFKPKVIIVTGEDDPDILAKLGPILGHDWSPGDDMITFNPAL